MSTSLKPRLSFRRSSVCASREDRRRSVAENMGMSLGGRGREGEGVGIRGGEEGGEGGGAGRDVGGVVGWLGLEPREVMGSRRVERAAGVGRGERVRGLDEVWRSAYLLLMCPWISRAPFFRVLTLV